MLQIFSQRLLMLAEVGEGSGQPTDPWERIFKKRTKRKPKPNKTEHGMEKTKSKVDQVKKIQLEGLKLPNLKLYY
ncbi:hypothetical protein Tco_1337820 [Tanacetum coccineum]